MKRSSCNRHDFLLLFILALLVAPLTPARVLHVTLLNYIGLYAIVALGLVMLTGVGGLTSFGQAAFRRAGRLHLGLPDHRPWGFALADAARRSAGDGAGGALAGTRDLRLSGHFLPLGTIAWGMSLYYLFGNLEALGGHTGISSIPPLQIPTWKSAPAASSST
jgi:branched-chain amino acid transport system permease protein